MRAFAAASLGVIEELREKITTFSEATKALRDRLSDALDREIEKAEDIRRAYEEMLAKTRELLNGARKKRSQLVNESARCARKLQSTPKTIVREIGGEGQETKRVEQVNPAYERLVREKREIDARRSRLSDTIYSLSNKESELDREVGMVAQDQERLQGLSEEFRVLFEALSTDNINAAGCIQATIAALEAYCRIKF